MKKKLRDEILSIRESLSDKEINEKSKKIYERLLESSIYKKSSNIFTYVNFKNEVKTDMIINHSLLNTDTNQGKKVFIPLCNTSIKEIILCEIHGFDELKPNKMGILEPRADIIRIANRKDIDMAIVPGAVFDKEGNRIGYGAGYYDKFFSSLKKDIVKIGICYDFQLVDFAPSSPHDVPMDYIITDKRMIKI